MCFQEAETSRSCLRFPWAEPRGTLQYVKVKCWYLKLQLGAAQLLAGAKPAQQHRKRYYVSMGIQHPPELVFLSLKIEPQMPTHATPKKKKKAQTSLAC